MSAVALPSRLVAPPTVRGDDRVNVTSIKVLPANASGSTTFSPTDNSRILFNIPSYSKSFIDPSRSYLEFTVKTSANTAKFVDGIPIFNRLTTKIGSVLVEDITDYHVLERAVSLYDGVDYSQSRQWVTGDYSDARRNLSNVAADALVSKVLTEQFAGRTYTKPLMSGILGKGQDFYVPVSLLNSGGQSAIQMEMYLADHNEVLQSTGSLEPTYVVTDVSLHLELVEISERGMSAFQEAIMSGGTMSLPFKSFRSYRQFLPSGQTHVNFNVVDNSANAELLMLAMRPQSALSGYTNVGSAWTGVATAPAVLDSLSFVGGTETDSVVSKFQLRYGNKNYPNQPIENRTDSTPTILQGLACYDMLHKPVRLLSNDTTNLPIFETSSFLITQNFKVSSDSTLDGLNTSASASPLELSLDFSAQTDNVALTAFVKSSYSLQINQNGAVSLVQGRVA